MVNVEEIVKRNMVKAFGVPPEDITDDSALHNVKNWDSKRHMSLIMNLEKELKIRFDDDEIPTMVDFQIIVATICAHLS